MSRSRRAALKRGDSSTTLRNQNSSPGRDRGEDEGWAPAEMRHHEQGDDGRENEPAGEQRKHDAAGADRAQMLWPDFGGVGRSDRQFAGTAETGEEPQRRRHRDAAGEAAERGGRAVEHDGEAQGIATAHLVGEVAEADRSERIADEGRSSRSFRSCRCRCRGSLRINGLSMPKMFTA